MSKCGSQGYNKNNSRKKMKNFRKFINTHAEIAKIIIEKYNRKWASEYYYYIDLYAGEGRLVDKRDRYVGSPIIFLKTAKRLGLHTRGIFIEKNKMNSERLRFNIKKEGFKFNSDASRALRCKDKTKMSIFLETKDNKKVLPKYYSNTRRKRFGLLYADHNGIPDFDLIADISHIPCYEKLDILINCNCAAIKRRNKRNENSWSKNHLDTRALYEYLDIIDKNYIYISKPYGVWQWTMIYCTNWKNSEFIEKLGFFDVESEVGNKIMTKIDLTNFEYKTIYKELCKEN
jgi:three-Cys-motif partner protein